MNKGKPFQIIAILSLTISIISIIISLFLYFNEKSRDELITLKEHKESISLKLTDHKEYLSLGLGNYWRYQGYIKYYKSPDELSAFEEVDFIDQVISFEEKNNSITGSIRRVFSKGSDGNGCNPEFTNKTYSFSIKDNKFYIDSKFKFSIPLIDGSGWDLDEDTFGSNVFNKKYGFYVFHHKDTKNFFIYKDKDENQFKKRKINFYRDQYEIRFNVLGSNSYYYFKPRIGFTGEYHKHFGTVCEYEILLYDYFINADENPEILNIEEGVREI